MREDGERPLNIEDRAFLHTLHQRHYRELLDFARRMGFREELAEDFVQDTFLVAIKRVEDLRTCLNPAAWLTQVLKNVIGGSLRSARYAVELQKKLQDRLTDTSSRLGNEPGAELLYRGTISDEELSLLLRFYVEGRSQRELAAELGITTIACKKRIQRAKEHLREALEREP